MKKIQNSKFIIHNLLFVFIALTVLILIGCDKVDAPYKITKKTVPTEPNPSNKEDSIYDTKRIVLIEEYTGHQCGKCPPGAEKLHDLIETYHTQLVPITIHSGFFAKYNVKPFTTNLTSSVSDELYDSFGLISAGNPIGIVNRKSTSGSITKGPGEWEAAILSSTSLNPDVVLAFKKNYNTKNNSAQVTVFTKFKNSLKGNYKLCVYLTEDSLIGPQVDYRIPSPNIIPDYVFEHILRGSLNTTWGETIGKTDPVASETEVYTKSYSVELDKFLIKKSNPCNVVAFVYNAETKEVIQASMKKIK